MKKLYNFIECMCAAGLTGCAYETPATNSGNYFDVYCKKKSKKKKILKNGNKKLPF